MVFVYAVGALFAADVILHLASAFRGWDTLRCITKAMLMPLLAVTFVLLWTELTPAYLPWRVALGLIAGCMGDIALLNHRSTLGVYLGLGAFSVGHVLYMLQLCLLMPTPAAWQIAVAAIVYLAGSFPIFAKLKPHMPIAQLIPGSLYFLLLSTLSATAALHAFTQLRVGPFLLLAGTLLFLLSDTVLAFEIFRSETRHSHVKIMVPYIAAQTLIAAGFLLSMMR